MPIIIGTENPQREFRQSNTYTAIKCLLNSLVLSKVAPFNSNTLIQDKTFEMLLTQDCENWSSNITHTPFKLFIYLCHNNVHTIVEIWTLTLSPSFPRDDLSTESLIDDLSLSDVNKSIADELIKSMQGFLTLLPFHVWAKSSMLGKNELPWEPQYGKSSFPLNIDNLNCFRFQDVETSHGKLTLQVEYLPQLGFPTGSQKPILVISPLHSHTITRCHSDYSLVVPITSPESDRSFSFLSSSLNSSNNESNSMDDIIFTPDINIQLSSPIGKQNESPFKFPLPISPTKQINPSNFSTPTARPGTPPPNRSLLNRSAPVGIPRAKSSPMSISGFSSSNEDDSPINPFGLSRSVPTTWLNDDDDIDEIKTYRRHSISLSPSELIGPFVGSFQESLLSGHMSNTPSTLYTGFVADLAASGKNFIPPHIKISFNTIFYHVDHETPYVGTIELDKRGYKVPQKGIVQVTVLNPSQTPIKTFLVKYDLTDMPPQTKTFVRQKIVGSHPFILRYAIHLKFVQPKKGKFYLYKNIRIVFAHRTPDENEALQTLYEYPDEPKYFPYSRGSSARLRRSLSTSADSLNSSTEIVDNEDDDSTDYSTKTVVDDSVTMSL